MSKKAKARAGKRPKATATPDGPLLRWGPIAIGLLFLVAGLSKMLDPHTFYAALPGYGINGALRSLLAAFVPAFEIALAVALLSRWGLRQTALAASAFLAVFMVAISYGWWLGTLEECGCFGALLKRSPRDALLVDLAFLGLAVAVWRKANPRAVVLGWQKAVAGVAGVFALAITLSLLQVAPTGLAAVSSAALNAEMAEVDLSTGEHLLYLFHYECPHCAEMSPRVAAYTRDPSLPAVVAFTFRTPQREIDAYREEYGLHVPMQELPGATFASITGEGSVPQLVYVRDGEIVRSWLGLLPNPEEIGGLLRPQG